MKKASLLPLGVLTAALCLPISVQAQTDTLVYGRATLTLVPALLQSIAGAGATVTDLAGNPLRDGASLFELYGGYIDLKSGAAEGIGRGGFQIAFQGQTLRAQDFVYENGPGGQFFTANFVLNGSALGRGEVFRFPAPAPGPVPLQNGALQLNGIPFQLAPRFVDLINGALKQAAVSSSADAGKLSEYIVYVPDGVGLQN